MKGRPLILRNCLMRHALSCLSDCGFRSMRVETASRRHRPGQPFSATDMCDLEVAAEEAL
jgi:hypothetical protein